MIPKNQKTATSTNQQARITSKHELTSVQSSCIPTNQHHEPRTRIPASTKQQSPTKDTNQPATSTKQQSPTKDTNQPAFKVAAYLPTSTTNQPATSTKQARTSRHVSPAFKAAAYLPTSSQHQPARTSRHVLPAGYEPTNDKKI